LPYLQAVIKEGLRIWPPVVGLMAKEVPAGGDVLHGKFVPGGIRVGYYAFELFRDKAIWGEDAGVFRPEWWLETDSTDEERARIHQMESNLELILAAGKWQCLGKNVAQIELNKIFVEVRPLLPSTSFSPHLSNLPLQSFHASRTQRSCSVTSTSKSSTPTGRGSPFAVASSPLARCGCSFSAETTRRRCTDGAERR
jgi:hypothetical protein